MTAFERIHKLTPKYGELVSLYPHLAILNLMVAFGDFDDVVCLEHVDVELDLGEEWKKSLCHFHQKYDESRRL